MSSTGYPTTIPTPIAPSTITPVPTDPLASIGPLLARASEEISQVNTQQSVTDQLRAELEAAKGTVDTVQAELDAAKEQTVNERNEAIAALRSIIDELQAQITQLEIA